MSITLPPLGAMSVSKNATWCSWRHAGRFASRCRARRRARRALVREELVGAHEMDEGRRHRPVLGLAAAGEQVLSDLDGKQLREVEIADVSDRHERSALDLGARRSRIAGPFSSPHASTVQRRRGGRADGNLTGFGRRSPSRRSCVAAGPVMTSSRCRSPTRKKSKAPLWMPTDMRSVTRPDEVRSLPADRICAACRARHGRHGSRARHRRTGAGRRRHPT